MRSRNLVLAHVLFGKPVATFPGHALILSGIFECDLRGSGLINPARPPVCDHTLTGDVVGGRRHEPEQRWNHDGRIKQCGPEMIREPGRDHAGEGRAAGRSAFTVTPVPARSCDQMIVSDSTAALEGP